MEDKPANKTPAAHNKPLAESMPNSVRKAKEMIFPKIHLKWVEPIEFHADKYKNAPFQQGLRKPAVASIIFVALSLLAIIYARPACPPSMTIPLNALVTWFAVYALPWIVWHMSSTIWFYDHSVLMESDNSGGSAGGNPRIAYSDISEIVWVKSSKFSALNLTTSAGKKYSFGVPLSVPRESVAEFLRTRGLTLHDASP